MENLQPFCINANKQVNVNSLGLRHESLTCEKCLVAPSAIINEQGGRVVKLFSY
jgi:hypothetical protein